MTVAVRKVVSQGGVMNGSSTTVSTLDGVEGRTDGALEQPQRSRNARAQARHRAKRKAYIEQLEETVTKLQTALHLTPEQVAAMPPAQIRIHELEQENNRLRGENQQLRIQLEQYTSPPTPSATSSSSHGHSSGYSHIPHSRPHSTQVPSLIHPGNRSGSHSPASASTGDSNSGNYFSSFDEYTDREKKRKRLSPDDESVEKIGTHSSAYLTPGGTPPHYHELHNISQQPSSTQYNGYTNGHANGTTASNGHSYLNSSGAAVNGLGLHTTTNGTTTHSKPPLSLALPLPTFGYNQSHSHSQLNGHTHTNGLSNSSSSSLLSAHHSHSNGHTNGYVSGVANISSSNLSGSSASVASNSFSASIPSLTLPSFPLPTPPISSASAPLPPLLPLSSLPSPILPSNSMPLPSPAPSPLPPCGISAGGSGGTAESAAKISSNGNRFHHNDNYNNSHIYKSYKTPSLSILTSFSNSSFSSLSSTSDPSNSSRSLPPHILNPNHNRSYSNYNTDPDSCTPSPPSTMHSVGADIQSHNGTTNGSSHNHSNGVATPSSASSYLPPFSSHLTSAHSPPNGTTNGSVNHHLHNGSHSNGQSHTYSHTPNTNGHSTSYSHVVPKTEEENGYPLSAHTQSPQNQTSHGHFSPSLSTTLHGFGTDHGPSSASSQSAHSWNNIYSPERVAVHNR